MSRALVVIVACALAAVVASASEQWPMFRGPDIGAIPDDPALPESWSETENVKWKTEIPGLGWSSPVVWDDHIFVTAAVSSGQEKAPVPGLYDEHDHVKAAAPHRWIVYDVDFNTGKIRWQREMQNGEPPILRHVKNSFASESAVTDGQRVYVYFGSIGLAAALDLKGNVIWTKTLEAYNTQVELGTGASPVLYKGRLYIVHDNTKQSYMVALDARTGAVQWRVDRQERGNWSTPFVWENGQRTEIVTTGTVKVRSYSLDGKELWQLAGMTTLTIPSPFAKDGLLYLSSGYPGASPRPVYAIKPGATGDISLKEGETSNEYIAWYQPFLGTYNTSALVYRGYYYTLLDRGFLLCHDAKTGKEIYGRKRLSPDTSGFTASPWAYNGKIFVLSEDGDTYVVQAGPEFKILGKNSLGDMPLATPAVVRGSVILRTSSKLYRITKAVQK